METNTLTQLNRMAQQHANMMNHIIDIETNIPHFSLRTGQFTTTAKCRMCEWKHAFIEVKKEGIVIYPDLKKFCN